MNVCNSSTGIYGREYFQWRPEGFVSTGNEEAQSEKKGWKKWERVYIDCYDWFYSPNWQVDLTAYILHPYRVRSASVMFNKLPDWLSGCVIVPSGYWETGKQGEEKKKTR